MSAKQKNVLLNMLYYTLAGFTIVFAILFMIFLSTQASALYQQIMYYALAVIVILLVVLDIICTVIRSNKFIIGVLVYALAIITILMGMVLYLLMNIDGAIVAANLFGYTGMMALSYMIVGMLIAIYCIGEKLVSNTARISKRKTLETKV